MKRFLVFGFDTYYPCGGLSDVRSEADSLEEAIKMGESFYADFRYIFDCETRETVKEWE